MINTQRPQHLLSSEGMVGRSRYSRPSYRLQISVHVLFCRRTLESRKNVQILYQLGSTNPNFV